METASLQTTAREPPPDSAEDIDLDRVVWDAEYRHAVKRLLSAAGGDSPPAGRGLGGDPA